MSGGARRVRLGLLAGAPGSSTSGGWRRAPNPLTTRALVLSLALTAAGEAAVARATDQGRWELRYDTRVAWLEAGELAAAFRQFGDRYELVGMVATSGMMDRFFRWRGTFAATGRMIEGFPRTTAYLLFEEDDDGREVLLATGATTTIHATNRDSKEQAVPPGSDLMSVLFLAPHCLPEAEVHDGEDAYGLRLVGTAEVALRQPPPYFSGQTTRCDYRFRYENGGTRRISLWLAALSSASRASSKRLPVRIRVRVPLLPDVLLRLDSRAWPSRRIP